MKRTSLLLTVILIAQFALAKDHVIVIKAGTPSNPQATEVKTDGDTETITITPATDATTVTATVRDVFGTIMSQDAVSASATGSYVLTVPNLPAGTILEIRDNNGVVYTSYDY